MTMQPLGHGDGYAARSTAEQPHRLLRLRRGDNTYRPPQLILASLPIDVREAIDEAQTLAGRLRAFFAGFSAQNPCTLSAPELAEILTRTGDVRGVRRAMQLVRETYGTRFREISRSDRRVTLTIERWIESNNSQGGGVDTRSLSDLVNDTPLTRSGNATRARAREGASQISSTRSRAKPLALPPLPPELQRNEGMVLDAIRTRHGDLGVRMVLVEVRSVARYRERPEEALRAARTLAQRSTAMPLRMFRYLFARACEGDLLCDAQADAERICAAELAECVKDPDYASRAQVRREPRPPPHPLRAKAQGIRDRLALLAPHLPLREQLEAELAALERAIAALPPPPAAPPPVADDEINLRWSEHGPRSTRVVSIPGTSHRIVVHEDTLRPPEPELDELFDESKCEALDRDDGPAPAGEGE